LDVQEATAKKRKRPLSLADVAPKKTKAHPAVELLNTLIIAILKSSIIECRGKST
jgi:hypothetical protein